MQPAAAPGPATLASHRCTAAARPARSHVTLAAGLACSSASRSQPTPGLAFSSALSSAAPSRSSSSRLLYTSTGRRCISRATRASRWSRLRGPLPPPPGRPSPPPMPSSHPPKKFVSMRRSVGPTPCRRACGGGREDGSGGDRKQAGRQPWRRAARRQWRHDSRGGASQAQVGCEQSAGKLLELTCALLSQRENHSTRLAHSPPA